MSGDYSWLDSLFSNLWGIGFVALILGGSIFIHELGHFLAARWRGLKVDRFSLGFGPKIWGWTGQDGVDYRISWFPVGGYVALPQLADMSEIEGERSDVKNLPPISYLDKMIVIVAGVVFNLLLAVVLSLVLWLVGNPEPAPSETQVIGYVVPTMDELKDGVPARELPPVRPADAPAPDNTPSPAAAAGLQPGDKIVSIDGTPIRNFQDLTEAIALGSGRDAQNNPRAAITFERDGVTKTVDVLPALIAQGGDSIRTIGLSPADKMVVDDVELHSPALTVHQGDELISLNGHRLYSIRQLNELIATSGDQPITLKINRHGTELENKIQPIPVPQTTPMASITVAASGARLDVLPVYAREQEQDQLAAANPATAAQKLIVWNVANQGGVFGDLHPGDYLNKVNDQPFTSIKQLVDALKTANATVRVGYTSKGTNADGVFTLPANFAATVTPPMESRRLGIVFRNELISVKHPPWRQFADALNQIFGMLGALFNPHSDIGVRHLSGPLGIGAIIYKFSLLDVRLAIWFAFVINVNLAILNLLPIPVLDGGHIVIFTIGRLRRRELPVNFIAAAQGVCMVLLMSLILYVFYNDSRRLTSDRESDEDALLDRYYYLAPSDDMRFPVPAQPAVPPAPVMPVTTN